jgi:hypothetical protein
MRTTKALFGLSAAAVLLSCLGLLPACVGSNVTLGSAPDDPEIPHRAPAAASRTATPEASLGDPVALTSEPCVAKGVHARAVVPRPEDLDRSYRGALPGIEIRRTLRSGTGGFRNAVLAEGAVEVDLWARGTGLVAGAVGYETCTGGAKADVSFEIIAHYR